MCHLSNGVLIESCGYYTGLSNSNELCMHNCMHKNHDST